MSRHSLKVLCLICAQEASNAAWEAHLADRPMTWLHMPRCWEFWTAAAVERAK